MTTSPGQSAVERPVLLDLFCKAGGCSAGYGRAGFEVLGVDIEPQPNYPYPFAQGDAIEFLDRFLNGEPGVFDAIHASPPCQAYSRLRAMHPDRADEYPMLIDAVRERLVATGLPYIIENVEDAPLAKQATLDGAHGVMLCGSMFGLGVARGHLRRHRLFETNFPVGQPTCVHRGPAVGVYGHGGHSGKHRMLYRAEAAQAMDIDWMTRDEMNAGHPAGLHRAHRPEPTGMAPRARGGCGMTELSRETTGGRVARSDRSENQKDRR